MSKISSIIALITFKIFFTNIVYSQNNFKQLKGINILNFTDSARIDVNLTKYITNYLHQKGLSTEFELNYELQNYDSSNSVKVTFRAYNIDICNSSVVVHNNKTNLKLVLGNIPLKYPDEESPEIWSELEADYLELLNYEYVLFKEKIKPEHVNSKRLCYYAQHDSLTPVIELNISINNINYLIIISLDRVVKKVALTYHSAKTTRVYKRNNQDKLSTFTLTTLNNKGLESKYFKIISKIYTPLSLVGNDLRYDTSSEEFEQLSCFVHTQEHLKFLFRNGFKWYGPSPLPVFIHDNDSNYGGNNASYTEEKNSDYRYISIGDGDGINLKNLAIDADVISHELGHLVIAKKLKNFNHESQLIHEGVADFFVLDKTNDSCLARTICGKNSPFCAVNATCLRSAQNNLKYNTSSYNHLPGVHFKSQLISGMLWDLKNKKIEYQNKVSKLLIRSIDYLKADSGVEDWIMSLYYANEVDSIGIKLQDLDAVVKGRNLDQYTKKIIRYENTYKNLMITCGSLSSLNAKSLLLLFLILGPLAILRVNKN